MSASTAIHEAAHAVVARKLGLSCGYVTIEPERFMRLAQSHGGTTRTLVPEHSLGHAEIARRFYPKRDASTAECDQAFCVALYAGAEAEIVINGKQEHCNQDREHAARVLGADAARLEPELRARANALVQEHRAAIEWVAKALDQQRTLIPLQVSAVLALVDAMAEGEEGRHP